MYYSQPINVNNIIKTMPIFPARGAICDGDDDDNNGRWVRPPLPHNSPHTYVCMKNNLLYVYFTKSFRLKCLENSLCAGGGSARLSMYRGVASGRPHVCVRCACVRASCARG